MPTVLAISFWLSARAMGGGRTAEEALRDGDSALAAGRWAEAAAIYGQFLKDFESAPEAGPILGRVYFALARCYVRKGDFPVALPAIQKAMESAPGATESSHQIAEKNQTLLLWKGMVQLEAGTAQEAAKTFADFLKLGLKPEGATARGMEKLPAERFFGDALLLRAIAMIRAGNAREAARWLGEQSASLSTLPDYFFIRAQLLRVEALHSVGEEVAALEGLLQISPFVPAGEVKLQLLAIALAQGLMQRGEPLLALRSLSIARSQSEVLRSQKAFLTSLETSATRAIGEDALFLRRYERTLRRDWKEFEQFRNWEDSVLLVRTAAFLDLQWYREAALALEAVREGGANEWINAPRCWLLAENPRRCLEAVQKFFKRFPESPQLPLARLFEGTAYLVLEDYDAAAKSFRAACVGEFAENARVQEAKALLMARKDEEVLQVLAAFTHSKNLFAEEALYLRGVALSHMQKYDLCRDAMSDLIRQFPKSEWVPAAHFLRAAAAYRQMDFPLAITELRQTLQQFSGFKDEAEALLLLGDALLDQGQIEQGIAAYRQVPCSSLGLHEMAIFRLGKTLKRLGRLDELKKEMECFQRDHPESPRLAEAIREIGRVHQEQGHPHLARQLYWKSLQQHGNNPNADAIEPLLQDLQKIYATEGRLADYRKQIVQIREQASAAGEKTLALRAAWAESRWLERENPTENIQFLSQLAKEWDVRRASSGILADFADSFFSAGELERAAALYRDILKWHPASNERHRALAGLARHARGMGLLTEAFSYWGQLLEQTPESRFVPEAWLARSLELMKTNDPEKKKQAASGLGEVIRHDLATRAQKVEALYCLGEMHLSDGNPGLAVPYFQRIYIAYGVEREWVARAYLRSALAFERLGDTRSAQRTYQEMVRREDLKGLPEFHKAEENLTQVPNR